MRTFRTATIVSSTVLLALSLLIACQRAPGSDSTATPEEVRALVLRAQAHYRAREWEQAIALFQQIVRQDPDTAEWWTELGWALNAVGRHEEALEALRRAEALAPENPWNPQGQARAYLALGRLSDALAAATRATHLDPTRLGPYQLRVRIYLERGQYDAVVAAALTGLRAHPDDAYLRRALAQAYEKLGWSDLAERTKEQVPTQEP